jgi:superfamily I DNA/RNA helicase
VVCSCANCGEIYLRVLSNVNPTPEQIQVVETDTYQTCIIRGGAGSGKTTAAALRCRKILSGIAADRRLSGNPDPIRLAVLTFNRTLKGYIENFIDEQVTDAGHPVDHIVDTFAAWAFRITKYRKPMNDNEREEIISSIWNKLDLRTTLTGKFIADEVDYILGRFGRANMGEYLTCERKGRGNPSLPTVRRDLILTSVIKPYLAILDARDIIDWNDCADQVLADGPIPQFDVIIADEVQDFTVQQVRAMRSRLKNPSSLTLVIDTAQSLYPRHIEWSETGIDINADVAVHKLLNNYRNSTQIAQFVQPLLTGMRLSDDGTIPDYTKCKGGAGRTPTIYMGRFAAQMAYAISIILAEVDLAVETVAILTKGGDGRGDIGRALTRAGLGYCDLTRRKDWPTGPENIGISTLNSAKGLEFDHVFILGFDTEFFGDHGADEDDYLYTHLRRILAMAVTRAKRTVVIGSRQNFRSDILDLFDPNTFLTVVA